MRIAVCVRPSSGGEIGPFDAAAYECALRVPGAEVILLAMAPPRGRETLEYLTRLGAKGAYLLSDPAFAGADTLATTYALSLALRRLAPDLVFCGRQTMEGDTGQVGPGIAQRQGYAFAAGVMELTELTDREVCLRDREGTEKRLTYPALLSFERIFSLRFPGLFSKPGTVTAWSAADIGADPGKCGAKGSPTKVVSTQKNEGDRRKCRFITPREFDAVFAQCLCKERQPTLLAEGTKTKEKILIVGEAPREMANTVGENILRISLDTPSRMANVIRAASPLAVLWDSTPRAKSTAAAVAVLLGAGLCADCTCLKTDGKTLTMYRPAFGGDLIAGIVTVTRPAMATVRTVSETGCNAVFALGLGAKEYLAPIEALAREKGADLAATRAMVDAGRMPYARQVGLTGKTVSPKVYVALGVSGAVHHIAGMKNALSVIAVNRDKGAPIFDYADFGIVADVGDFLREIGR